MHASETEFVEQPLSLFIAGLLYFVIAVRLCVSYCLFVCLFVRLCVCLLVCLLLLFVRFLLLLRACCFLFSGICFLGLVVAGLLTFQKTKAQSSERKCGWPGCDGGTDRSA